MQKWGYKLLTQYSVALKNTKDLSMALRRVNIGIRIKVKKKEEKRPNKS